MRARFNMYPGGQLAWQRDGAQKLREASKVSSAHSTAQRVSEGAVWISWRTVHAPANIRSGSLGPYSTLLRFETAIGGVVSAGPWSATVTKAGADFSPLAFHTTTASCVPAEYLPVFTLI